MLATRGRADAQAANVFAFEEPYYRVGAYREVLKSRWRNVLGRTMWDLAGASDDPGFLILGHGTHHIGSVPHELVTRRRRYLDDAGSLGRCITRGPLLPTTASGGWVARCSCSSRVGASADAMVAADPYVLDGLFTSVEVHHWHPGGRPEPPA